ncbi:hypothetical protein BJ742DRAFT_904398 [Cladochytrium replicatum]|nr:hypothetical protein BJ742DRAFT_904398 [Cladochytrium replicatum]
MNCKRQKTSILIVRLQEKLLSSSDSCGLGWGIAPPDMIKIFNFRGQTIRSTQFSRAQSGDISVPDIVNDTVGTLISHAYSNPHTYVGVIRSGMQPRWTELPRNPGRQTFEKLISGMYLGELFGGKKSPHLLTPYCFGTALMSRIEKDHTTELADTRTVLEEILKSPATSIDDRTVVK